MLSAFPPLRGFYQPGQFAAARIEPMRRLTFKIDS
jgi:hypothetical protein